MHAARLVACLIVVAPVVLSAAAVRCVASKPAAAVDPRVLFDSGAF